MQKRRPSTKRTKEEIAESIMREGTVVRNDYRPASTIITYYRAFGQLWRITATRGGTLQSIEQVNENYERISL